MTPQRAGAAETHPNFLFEAAGERRQLHLGPCRGLATTTANTSAGQRVMAAAQQRETVVVWAGQKEEDLAVFRATPYMSSLVA